MKVRFKQTRVVQDDDAGTARETRYEAGQIIDLPEPSARHWVRRGVAEIVAAQPETQAPAEVQNRAAPYQGQVKRGPGRPRKTA